MDSAMVEAGLKTMVVLPQWALLSRRVAPQERAAFGVIGQIGPIANTVKFDLSSRFVAYGQEVAGTMTPDEERWAEALAIERIYGDHAPVWIAERIGALALAGDAAGVQRFREIAAKFELLLAGQQP